MKYFNCKPGDKIRIINPNSENIAEDSIWLVIGEGFDEADGLPHLIIQGEDVWGIFCTKQWYCDDEDYEII